MEEIPKNASSGACAEAEGENCVPASEVGLAGVETGRKEERRSSMLDIPDDATFGGCCELGGEYCVPESEVGRAGVEAGGEEVCAAESEASRAGIDTGRGEEDFTTIVDQHSYSAIRYGRSPKDLPGERRSEKTIKTHTTKFKVGIIVLNRGRSLHWPNARAKSPYLDAVVEKRERGGGHTSISFPAMANGAWYMSHFLIPPLEASTPFAYRPRTTISLGSLVEQPKIIQRHHHSHQTLLVVFILALILVPLLASMIMLLRRPSNLVFFFSRMSL